MASDGSVYINGQPVVYPADFAKGFTRKEKLITTVGEANTGVVKVGGAAGARLTVSVIGHRRCIVPSIVSPADGATVDGGDTLVSGTVDMSEGTELGVTVNGMIAEVNGTSFALSGLPLLPGDNYITALATDDLGNTARQVIKVTASQAAADVSLTASPASGQSPLAVTFTVGSTVVGAAAFTFDYGDGTAPVSAATLDALAQAAGTHTYNANGMYHPELTVTDGESLTYTKTAVVNVSPPPNLGGKWDGMKAALVAGNIPKAAGYFSTTTREAYTQQFRIMSEASLLGQAAAGMGTFSVSKQIGRAIYGEMLVVRYGAKMSFFVLFVQDDDGIWRLKSF